jgi:hypothetical protein
LVLHITWVVLKLVGFGVVNVVGFNLAKNRLEISPSKSHIMGVCLGWECGWRHMMEQMAGAQMQSYNGNSTSPHTSHRSIHTVLDTTKEIPKVGNISISHFVKSPDHFTRFCILRIEVLFQVGDKIFRV